LRRAGAVPLLVGSTHVWSFSHFFMCFVHRVCGRCKFVPGLSEQQRQFSLISITSGAFLSGAVLRNGLSRWTYIFLFIWVPWIGLVRRVPFPNTT
jgi:hypothetical protein